MFSIRNKIPFIGALVLTAALACGYAAMPTNPLASSTPTPVATTIYGSATVWGEDVEEVVAVDEATIVVKSQKTGVVGELIRFDVSESVAESFKWLLVPESVDFEVYDNGKRAVFSARKPGDYMFVVACGYKGTVDVTTHMVTIRPNENDVPPEPDDWPVIVPPTAGAGISKYVTYWCAQEKLPQADTKKLAGSFESIAAMISAGVYKTPQEIIEATGAANKEALGDRLEAWIPVLKLLQDKFQKMAQDGELVTPEQHAVTWRAVAEGLNAYASAFNVSV